jgi:hypothetical protein
MPTLRLAACPNLRCKVDCLVPDNLLNSSIKSIRSYFCDIFPLSFYIYARCVCQRRHNFQSILLTNRYSLFQTGKSSKAFLINFWEQHCIDALYTKSRGALNWWCSIGRQFTADTCTSRFQIFPLKVVVGIHDKNSVTERVSMSVQMLLPVRINTWK